MASIEDLKAKVEAARAALMAAEQSGDAEKELAAVDALDAAEGALLDAGKADRKLRGKRMERQARGAAGGKYQVGMYDIASALPQLDASDMPGAGVVVFRSAPPDARKAHETVVGAQDSDAAATFAAHVTLICECLVAPMLEGPAALACRAWWEGPGRGLVNLVALEIGRLGGFQLAAFQRATR